MTSIFISHSSQDYDLASELTSFFRLIFNGDEEFVFCSSVNSIGAAKDSEEVILHSIQSSQFNMFIVTEHFLASPFCMCELGAGWVQNKKPYIFLAGIERNDSRLLHLPRSLMAAQNIVVREGDPRSIKFWLRDLISQISKSLQISIEESDYLTDMQNLIKYLSESPNTNTNISMLNTFCFHDPAGTPIQAFEIIESTLNSTTLGVNYCDYKPNYAGLVINLYNSSWTKSFDQGKALSFDITGTKEIESIDIELKGNTTNDIILRKKFKVSELTQNHSIVLSSLGIPRNQFRNLTELVFVMHSNIEGYRGKFKIENICLK